MADNETVDDGGEEFPGLFDVLTSEQNTITDELRGYLSEIGFYPTVDIDSYIKQLRKIIDDCADFVGKKDDLLESCVEFIMNAYFDQKSENNIKNAIISHLGKACDEVHILVGNFLREFIEKALDSKIGIGGVMKDAQVLWSEVKIDPKNLPHLVTEVTSGVVKVIDWLVAVFKEYEDRNTVPSYQVLRTLELTIKAELSLLQKYRRECEEHTVDLEELCSRTVMLLERQHLSFDNYHNVGFCAVLSTYLQEGSEGCVQLYGNVEKYDHVIKLVVYNGILSVLPTKELEKCYVTVANDKRKPMFEVLVFRATNLHDGYPNNGYIAQAVSRLMHPVTQCIKSHSAAIKEEVVNAVLEHLWFCMNHYIESVKHVSRDQFETLVQSRDPRILKYVATLLDSSEFDERCCAILRFFARIMQISSFLRSRENLTRRILKFVNMQKGCNYLSHTYEILMAKDFEAGSGWEQVWVVPLFCSLPNNPVAMERLLLTACSISLPPVLPLICYHLKMKGQWVPLLRCLVEIKRQGILNKAAKKKNGGLCVRMWKDQFSSETMQHAIHSYDPEVSIAAATLLAEGFRDEGLLVSPTDLKSLTIFFHLNIANTRSGFRDKIIKIMSEAARRVSHSLRTVNQRIAEDGSDVDPTMKTLRECYYEFIEGIVERTVTQIFPGASYARVYTSLNVLDIFRQEKLLSNAHCSHGLLNNLWYGLLDSYEDNQKLAAKLLMCLPFKIPEYQDPVNMRLLATAALKLSTSMRPADTTAAAYLFEFLAHRWYDHSYFEMTFLNSHMAKQYRPEDFRGNGVMHNTFMFGNMLLTHSTTCVQVNNNSVTRSPVFGAFTCVHHLLKTAQVECIVKEDRWCVFFELLIRWALMCSRFATGILETDCPEGFVPSNDMYLQKMSNKAKAAQIALLCSWRTLKEAAFLISELVEISFDAWERFQKPIFQDHVLVLICEHFTHWLTYIRHKGAFEQVYRAFNDICRCIFSCRFPMTSLQEKIRMMVDTHLNTFMNKSDQLCRFRRGAGVPHVIQALLCAEKQLTKGCKSPHFATVVTKLFAVVESRECTVQSKVNAFNILRALFKSAAIGDEMLTFAERSFVVAIEGFKSCSWLERNASALFLSAVITRVFGVPADKDPFSGRNRMPAHLFFRRYPRLCDYFLEQLRNSANKMKSLRLQAAIIPVLLVLSRIFLSHKSHPDPKVGEFLTLIYQCSGSPVLKVRELAVSAILSGVTPGILIQHIEQLWRHFLVTPEENAVHGLLLQMEQLLMRLRYVDEMKNDRARELFNKPFLQAKEILLSRTKSYVSKTVYLRCLMWIFGFKFESLPKKAILDTNDCLQALLLANSNLSVVEMNKKQFYSMAMILIFGISFHNKFCKKKVPPPFIDFLRKMIARESDTEVLATILDLFVYNKSEEDCLKENEKVFVFLDLTQVNRKEMNRVMCILLTQEFFLEHINNPKDKNLKKVLLALKHVTFANNAHIVSALADNIAVSRNDEANILALQYIAKQYDFSTSNITTANTILALKVVATLFVLSLPSLSYKLLVESTKMFVHNFTHIEACCFKNKLHVLLLDVWVHIVRISLIFESQDFKELANDPERNFGDRCLMTTYVRKFIKRTGLKPVERAAGLLAIILYEVGRLYYNDHSDYVFAPENNYVHEDELSLCMFVRKSFIDFFVENPTVLKDTLDPKLLEWLCEKCCIALPSYSVTTLAGFMKLVEDSTEMVPDTNFLSYVKMNEFHVKNRILARHKLYIIMPFIERNA